MATKAAVKLMTRPDIARDHNLHLDRLREFLRKRPDLAELGIRIGGATAYPPEAVERILHEFRAAK